jgi:iron(III) transport system substrate-binding protein
MAHSWDRTVVVISLIAAIVLAALWLDNVPDELVVYCSHDEVYAQQVLDDFTRETGIRVRTRFDTEATKSLGLINLISQERQHPRCDVFWNNELLGMVELREQGLLESYQGAGWKRMPEQFRDADGYWVGFAARLRVYIFNIQQASPDDETVASLLSLEPSKVVMAKPLFGTTLTQFTVMWHLWGAERLKAWHTDLRLRGLREVNGNAAVKDVVAQGTCDAGMTDTDDYFVAVDDKQPVEMRPIRVAPVTSDQPDLGTAASTGAPSDHEHKMGTQDFTICIPNTVGIIKSTKRRAAAQRLVDFLTSANTELALAKAKSRQIPLGPMDETQLPADAIRLAEWARDGIDLRPLLPARRECLKWLQGEYLK